MIANKHLFLTTVVFLVACAPHHTAIETAPRATTSAVTKTGIKIKEDNSLVADTMAVSKSKEVLPVLPTDKTIKTTRSAETVARVAGNSPAKVSSWEISGAMAARNKNKGWSASLNWIQNGPGQYQIRLFGPLGSGTVLINKKSGLITYRDGPKTATSSNADELLKQQTGVRLPVSNLFYWVRGLPSPGAIQAAKRDEANHLIVLQQAGYTIQYAQYTTVGNYVLPSQIKLQGNGVFIKVVIKHWRV